MSVPIAAVTAGNGAGGEYNVEVLSSLLRANIVAALTWRSTVSDSLLSLCCSSIIDSGDDRFLMCFVFANLMYL
jgi:hypothetical protein